MTSIESIHCEKSQRYFLSSTLRMVASYAVSSVLSVPSFGRQPPISMLPSSLKVPVYVAPNPEWMTVLPWTSHSYEKTVPDMLE